MNKIIDEAVRNIASTDARRRELARKILPLNDKSLSKYGSTELLEEKLILPVEKALLNGTIAGVDSGFVGKNLFSLDLILIRAVAAIFQYENSRLKKAEYLPNFFSFPEPHLSSNALETHDFEISKSLKRLIEEVNLSKRTIIEKNPDYLFIDGSIIPQHQDKPRKESKLKTPYHELLHNFQEFYEVAEKNNCELIACVEDSRGSRFRTLLQEEILAKENFREVSELDECFDSVLLDYLLKKGERSFAFTYSKSISEHPILMDYAPKWANKVHAFYLKPAEYDRPLRVEFLSNGNISKQASKIASIVYAQSSQHKTYAYPAVLIEADMRARLKPEEIDIIYNKILDKLSKGFKVKLRRENRPFK